MTTVEKGLYTYKEKMYFTEGNQRIVSMKVTTEGESAWKEGIIYFPVLTWTNESTSQVKLDIVQDQMYVRELTDFAENFTLAPITSQDEEEATQNENTTEGN